MLQPELLMEVVYDYFSWRVVRNSVVRVWVWWSVMEW